MGFLKKFGQAVLKGFQIVEGIAPYATPIVQLVNPGAAGKVEKVVGELPAIAGIIQNVEGIGAALSLSGPQKLTAAAPLVAQVILASDLLAKHKIADQAKFQAACTQIASGVADLLSSLEDKVATTDKT